MHGQEGAERQAAEDGRDCDREDEGEGARVVGGEGGSAAQVTWGSDLQSVVVLPLTLNVRCVL